MELNDKIFDKIDSYLAGKMTNVQQGIFEAEMANQPELQEAVDMVRFEKQAQEHLIAKDLRTQVEEWEQNPLPKELNAKPSSRRGQKWILGLMLIGLVAAFLFLMSRSDEKENPAVQKQEISPVEKEVPIAIEEETTPTTEEMPLEKEEEKVAENKSEIKKEPTQFPTQEPDFEELYAYVETDLYTSPSLFNDDNLKSTEQANEDLVSRGKKAFIANDYQRSVTILGSIDKSSEMYEAAKEPLAHAYFKNRQFDKAANLFEEITNESTFLKDEPQWYWLLSMTIDYKNNKIAVDQLLNEILKKEEHQFKKEATDLQSKLDQYK